MKALFFIILFSLYISGCSKTTSKSKEENNIQEISKNGEWKVGDFYDDFHEPTGEKYIYKEVFGKFSNSATSSSPLRAIFLIYKNKEDRLEGEIKLDEYDNGVIDLLLYEDCSPSNYCKFVDFSNHKIFTKYNGSSFLFSKEDSIYYSSWLDMMLNNLPARYEVSISGKYIGEHKTIYNFSISTEGLETAFEEASIKFNKTDLF